MNDWETPCPVREDRQHCSHWYDGGPCCGCGDPADATIEALTPTTTKDGS